MFRRSAKPVAQQQSFQASHGLSHGLTLHRSRRTENLWKLTIPVDYLLWKNLFDYFERWCLPITLEPALRVYYLNHLGISFSYTKKKRFCRRRQSETHVDCKIYTERKKLEWTLSLLTTAPPIDFHVQFQNAMVFIIFYLQTTRPFLAVADRNYVSIQAIEKSHACKDWKCHIDIVTTCTFETRLRLIWLVPWRPAPSVAFYKKKIRKNSQGRAERVRLFWTILRSRYRPSGSQLAVVQTFIV